MTDDERFASARASDGKDDGAKPRLSLLPPWVLRQLLDGHEDENDLVEAVRSLQNGEPIGRYIACCIVHDPMAVLEVMEYGVRKYGRPDGWRQVPDAVRRYLDAALRHAVADMDTIAGSKIDPESGLTHRAHYETNIGFLGELT